MVLAALEFAQTSTTNGAIIGGGDPAIQVSTAQSYMEVAPMEPVDCGAASVHLKVGPADAKEEYDQFVSKFCNFSHLYYKIAVYSQRLGCQMYNFVSYPIGGVKRGFWKPNSTSAIPPPIDLPDVQLQNHLWETYVNAQISSWIDCDSENDELAALSEIELQKELNYCAYMGLRSAVFRLQHADSPRLARILNQWLWTRNVNLGKLCSNFSSQKLIGERNYIVPFTSSQVVPMLNVLQPVYTYPLILTTNSLTRSSFPAGKRSQ
ncbi:hypothetical protein TELCIR_03050 [Teladorsagia circumcincta]|uniref:PRMT5 TIM barrel domain-containing protein n=1 Tax=Teladorsagia circumcincta TaxID=45464 RepID=A0A2G9UYX3_TELCI|nr:hypothetical protein TELCIR_03050 [Teladorsagia circumcincta]